MRARDESAFAELKRYVRFGAEDEEALRALHPVAFPRFAAVANEFYARLDEHEGARAVFQGPEQIERLKGTLAEWMDGLFRGPWDEEYHRRRQRIGRIHVRIGLPQRYMFGAMNLIRLALSAIAEREYAADVTRRERAVRALEKICDLELAIMLESYREAWVEKVQAVDKVERGRLEERLAISEARYEEIVEKAWSLVTTFDREGTILLFNRRCEELTGLSRGEAIGRTFYELFVTPERHDEVTRLLARAPLERHVYEGPFSHSDGGERRVRWHLTTLPSGTGPVSCAMGIDVTEEHALAVRSRRAERLAALGTMAAGLAHEIRNPLNAAHLQLTVVGRRLARPGGADVGGARQALDLVSSEMRRLAGLVQEFLQFARPQPLRLLELDLRALSEEVLSLIAPEAAESGAELTLEAGGPVEIDGDDERLKQVLLNLLRNAIEAVGRGGHVSLRVRKRPNGGEIQVEDDGPGLPSPDAPIFEPFFTTKASGTGLGLAIVHRIVTDHGGKVSVESRPGRTVFTISLPAGFARH